MSYGYCPICGAKGVSRERSLNGDDRCVKGHVYKSSLALTEVEHAWKEAGGTSDRGNQHTWPSYKILELQPFVDLIIKRSLIALHENYKPDDCLPQEEIQGFLLDYWKVKPHSCGRHHLFDEPFDEVKALNKLADEMASVIDNQILESLKK